MRGRTDVRVVKKAIASDQQTSRSDVACLRNRGGDGASREYLNKAAAVRRATALI